MRSSGGLTTGARLTHAALRVGAYAHDIARATRAVVTKEISDPSTPTPTAASTPPTAASPASAAKCANTASAPPCGTGARMHVCG